MLQYTLKMISEWDTSVKKQLYQNVCQCYLGEKKNKKDYLLFPAKQREEKI